MKPYGIRKKDDDCCPGHAKYGQRGLTAKGVKRPRRKHIDRIRKKKIRQEARKMAQSFKGCDFGDKDISFASALRRHWNED